MEGNKKRILMVASKGGHWIQLLRIAGRLREKYDITFCSTHPNYSQMVEGHEFHCIDDFSRDDIWRMFGTLRQITSVIKATKPAAIITTGAAPGLMAVVVGRLRGVRTVWIDSVANAGHLSASGRIASRIASRTYTQWKHLEQPGRVIYAGNVFG